MTLPEFLAAAVEIDTLCDLGPFPWLCLETYFFITYCSGLAFVVYTGMLLYTLYREWFHERGERRVDGTSAGYTIALIVAALCVFMIMPTLIETWENMQNPAEVVDRDADREIAEEEKVPQKGNPYYLLTPIALVICHIRVSRVFEGSSRHMRVEAMNEGLHKSLEYEKVDYNIMTEQVDGSWRKTGSTTRYEGGNTGCVLILLQAPFAAFCAPIIVLFRFITNYVLLR